MNSVMRDRDTLLLNGNYTYQQLCHYGTLRFVRTLLKVLLVIIAAHSDYVPKQHNNILMQNTAQCLALPAQSL